MDIPLCPCDSGILYEKCCFNILNNEGNRKFHKGACFSNDGITWHPSPHIQYDATIGLISNDKYRVYAKQLIDFSKLDPKHHQKFINLFAIFQSTHEKLKISLLKPGGSGVAFQVDSTEGRELWKQFLLNGRILIDFLGLHCCKCLKLKEYIDGLNAKKFNSLLIILDKQKNNDSYLEIISSLTLIKEDIIDFIAMRDFEKISGDTIINFPSIYANGSIKKDGVVVVNGKTFGMISFIDSSYENILRLTKTLLGITNKII
ncbi:MAG: hypothetical protein ACRCZE_02620 [Candidatus Altimarinota bacterium]